MRRIGHIEAVREIASFGDVDLLEARDGANPVMVVCPRAVGALDRREELDALHELLTTLDSDALLRPLGWAEGIDDIGLLLSSFPSVESLATVIERGPLDVLTALRVAERVTEALALLHCAGLVHRDVCPARIVMDPTGKRAALVGLELRQRAQVATPIEEAGSLAFIAPEQTGRVKRPVDERSDYYALGATLYAMLVGWPPFEGDAATVLHAHLARAPESPRKLRADVPEVVADIVLKLLAKGPEQRYQSAFALREDLRACIAALESGEALRPFALGASDTAMRIDKPKRRYGRARALASLEAVLDRAAVGECQVVELVGPAGAGVRSTARDAMAGAVDRGARAVTVTLAREAPRVPFGVALHAMRDLITSLLSEGEAALARYRERVEAAVGEDLARLVGLLPELGWVVGSSSPSPEVSGAEALLRLRRALRAALLAVATPARHVVVCVEGASWIDQQTADLVASVVDDPEARHVAFVLVTYEAKGAPLSPRAERVELAPLDERAVAALVGDVMPGVPNLSEVAAAVHARTFGNPGFALALLERASTKGVARRDPKSGAWCCDVEGLARLETAEMLADELVGRVSKLPPNARRALGVSALVAQNFSPEDVAPLIGGDAAHELVNLRSLGFLRLDAQGSYAVAHERIRDAAARALGAEAARVHAAIAARALAAEGGLTGDALFAALAHLEHADVAALEPKLRDAAVKAACAAGHRARATEGYKIAADAFALAARLLGDDAWEREHDRRWAIARDLAEAQYLSGAFDDAKATCDDALARASDDLRRARVLQIQAWIATSSGDLEGAVASVCRAVGMFGIAIGRNPSQERFGAEMGATEAVLATTDTNAILERPAMTSEEMRIVTELLVAAMSPVYQLGDVPMFCVITFTLVRLVLEHGNTAAAGYVFALYGMILSIAFARYAEADRYSRLGLAMFQRYPNLQYKASASLVYNINVRIWVEPMVATLDGLRVGEDCGRLGGELLYGGYCAYYGCLHQLAMGTPLSMLAADVQRVGAWLETTKDFSFRVATLALGEAARALSEPGYVDRTFWNPDLGDQATQWANVSPTNQALFHTTRLVTSYLLEEWDAAREAAGLAIGLLPAIAGNIASAHAQIFDAMLLCRGFLRAKGEERTTWRATIEERLEKLRSWEASSASNFGALRALLEGEWKLVGGDAEGALVCFEQAATLAEDAGTSHFEALGSERAAAVSESLGKKRSARVHLEEAIAAYERWGAVAKVDRLKAQLATAVARAQAASMSLHASLSGRLLTVSPSLVPGPSKGVRASIAVPIRLGEQLDLATVLDASRALSEEVVTSRLLDKLLRILVGSAGARRAAVLTPSDGGFRPRATAVVSNDVEIEHVPEGRSVPWIASAVTEYVARAQKDVLLEDARAEGQFQSDSTVRFLSLRSVLCMPLVSRGEISAIVYLDNDLVAGAFTAERAGLLRMLAAQMAISLSNARLYEELEARVEERTRALADVSRNMQQILDNVTFGFLVIDASLSVLPGYSQSCCALLETETIAGRPIGDLLQATGASRGHLDCSLMQVFDDILLEELLLSQVPNRLRVGERILSLEARAIRDDAGAVTRLLLTISDASALEEARRSAADNMMVVQILQRREAFQFFIADTRARLEDAARAVEMGDQQRVRRELHTIKGNAAQYGMTEVSSFIHQVEDVATLGPEHVASVEAQVRRVLHRHHDVLGIDLDAEGPVNVVVTPDDFARLQRSVAAFPPPHARAVRTWINQVRLLSARQALGPIEAFVAQLASRFGKDVEVNIDAGEVRVDADTVKHVLQSLPHLIRNAVDHGLELPSERLDKPPFATLSINIVDRSRAWVLTVSDDGRGIDEERLVERAIERGVCTREEALGMGRDEKLRLVFEDGLSTAAEVSDISGRGVGLAAVRDAVRRVGGRIEIESVPGVGTTFQITIPKPIDVIGSIVPFSRASAPPPSA
jgi:predicted ATPase/GAF domain-containing protein/HPt (histidine-containing phosphotransfer) domain-containing protein/two-component sensor histidine kinase